MNNNFDDTINYYNDNAQQFFDDTYNLDMSGLYKPFSDMLPDKASILDVGCGSGRDSLYFMKLGHEVTPFDASEKMVALSSKLLGIEVLLLDFDKVDFHNQFNGIWACAIFLHVPKNQMPSVFSKMEQALVDDGVMYASFKYGDGEKTENGRFFSYYTEKSFKELLINFPKLQIIRMWETEDVRQDGNHRHWLNVLVKKIKND
ncbi:class I SAM-dependent methyltransferase [Chloroflexota bacterium]